MPTNVFHVMKYGLTRESLMYTGRIFSASKRLLKPFSNKAAGSPATDAYPLGYVAGRRATENDVGERFQQPLVDALADFRRQPTLAARIVEGRNGKEIRLPYG